MFHIPSLIFPPPSRRPPASVAWCPCNTPGDLPEEEDLIYHDTDPDHDPDRDPDHDHDRDHDRDRDRDRDHDRDPDQLSCSITAFISAPLVTLCAVRTYPSVRRD